MWGGCKELLAAAELWKLCIVVVRRGHATVLVGKGERIVSLKLESRHYVFWRLTTLKSSKLPVELTSRNLLNFTKLP